MPIEKRGQMIVVSDEVFSDARTLQSALDEYMAATDEQRAVWAREATARRATERERSQHVPVSYDAVIGKLGWSDTYVEHFVQPYCYCEQGLDGWDYCQHAYDEGLRP